MAKIAQLLDMARRTGILHARDLAPLGIPRKYLSVLCARGLLEKTGRGLYVTPDAAETVHLGMVQAAKAVPKGVICLLSALRFHEIGTQAPRDVWMAIARGSAPPRLDFPPVRIVLFSGDALTEGIVEHDLSGVRVKVYSPAKTVADCFKYRNKIGLDVALEALRDVRKAGKSTNDELWKYARICRVAAIMRPYMEAIG